ncbi:hypothetical protein KI387_005990, partial [Taxus chinensis]
MAPHANPSRGSSPQTLNASTAKYGECCTGGDQHGSQVVQVQKTGVDLPPTTENDADFSWINLAFSRKYKGGNKNDLQENLGRIGDNNDTAG